MADSLYEIVSCDVGGANNVSHPEFRQESSAHDELNGAGSFSFSVTTHEANLASLAPNTREVQLWRSGSAVPVWWGRIIGRNYDPASNRFQIRCAGLLSYFDARVFGRFYRHNQLTNGSFDTGNMAPWGSNVISNIVNQWGGAPRIGYQLNLWNQGAVGSDAFANQTITVPGGVAWELSAYFHIRTDTGWVGPNLDGRGFYVERRDPTGTTVEDVKFYAIDDNTLRGVFQRADLEMVSPPGRNSVFDIRLYCPSTINATPVAPRPPGSIIWDDVQCVAQESSSWPDNDLGAILNGIVAHAQDPAYYKDDLKITGGSGVAGFNLNRTYQHVDHRGISDALKEFSDLGYCDTGIYFEPGTLRRIFAGFWPQRGSTRTDLSFELDATGGIRALDSVDEDGTGVVNSAMVQGDGSGPTREEGGWIDTTFTGEVHYEKVFQAQPGTHHDLLAGLAHGYVTQLGAPIRIPQFWIDGSYLGVIGLGDRIPVSIPSLGALSIQGNYRIVAIDIDIPTDRLKLTMNV